MHELTDTLDRYDASELAAGIRQREFSAVELMRAHLTRIERLNTDLNAFVFVDADEALRVAQDADCALATGRPWGPLHGVPISVKDAIDVAYVRTTAGDRRYANNYPKQDATAVSRLKRAGAIVIGKTNCAALCADIQTNNELFGTTRHPLDSRRTSGGSSGGEAVAVATGMSALGLGTDTAGSVRVPASYCGIYGFKPTLGKIERAGVKPMHAADRKRQDSLSAVGPLARSVRDLRLAYEILSGEQRSRTPAASMRLLWTQQFVDFLLADEVAEAMSDAAQRCRVAGLAVEKVDAPWRVNSLLPLYFLLNNYEFATRHNGFGWNRLRFAELMRSLRVRSLNLRYEKLKQAQAAAVSAFDSFIARGDCWVLPATATAAFEHRPTGTSIPLVADGSAHDGEYWRTAVGLSAPFNLLGNPSVTVPIGTNAQGLPIGAQLVGRRGDDARLLAIAERFADALRAPKNCRAPSPQRTFVFEPTPVAELEET
jgi:amidase